ncbi:TMV resistance protein N [Artemisia annua]|uniref:TMV resistance protein N n=1 Tax=Artemisia annua TaxID=35608 RepID=A0A2U1PUD8_ARTAN|nr:TMV resistance protein N [Artemisia annua]
MVVHRRLEASSSTTYPKYDAIINSSSANDPEYDIFLSFRGIDTRNTFTAHLHKALKYDDEEIEFGKPLKEELVNGTKASWASVIVFSENIMLLQRGALRNWHLSLINTGPPTILCSPYSIMSNPPCQEATKELRKRNGKA